MHIIGRIDVEIYKCIAENITTDEVVITDERIQHIKSRHHGDYDVIKPYIKDILASPDYILEDESRKNTGLLLKEICQNGLKFQLILILITN